MEEQHPPVADPGILVSSPSFTVRGAPCPGYLARPASVEDPPGVVVIQEWWGLDEGIKSIARRLAALGYAALAPDLYRGEVASEPDHAQRLYLTVKMPDATEDIVGAVDYLVACGARRVATLGFCLGGCLALTAACQSDQVAAVVDFYGPLPDRPDDLGRLTSPVLAFHGEDDTVVPASVSRTLQHELEARGKRIELHVYPGAGHAFFNDTRPSGYASDAASDAWERTVAFLDATLRPAVSAS
jgi:carboxymethylenebutenolidase